MVYTPEEVTDVSPSLRINQTTVKNPISWKAMCLFTNILYVRKENIKLCVGSAK